MKRRLHDATRGSKDPPGDWTESDVRERLAQLVSQSRTPDQAATRVAIEQAEQKTFKQVSQPIVQPVVPPEGGLDADSPIDHSVISDSLMDSIAHVESSGNPNAVSKKGAHGIYQMMPETAHDYRRYDPTESGNSREAAEAYLNDLLHKYAGNVRKMLAAYNWGPGNLDKDIAQADKEGLPWDRLRPSKFEVGVPKETADYLARLVSHYDPTSLAGIHHGGGDSTEITNNYNGPITVAVANGDPKTIAKGLKKAIVAQAETGPQ